MTDLKKTPLIIGKSKLEILRNVALTPASPITESPVAEPLPAAAVTPAPLKTEKQSPVAAPRVPSPVAPKTALKGRGVLVAHQFTFGFSEDSQELATTLAGRIGCKLEDIITLIAKRFDGTALDLNISTVKPRVGAQKRILLKIDQEAIAELRRLHDPLNVRSDGYLLRAPIIAALDAIATDVLNELKEQYFA
ncbi:hypothetical protein [Brucella intermedia]|uniref:hypothetical protein n=1 Tax=Brucella intermedia TaxID=94625 RepID=UPI0023601C62|nr:hypothetical protein [Brucella intermedia]